MLILLALMSALFTGGADFVGGLVSRRNSVVVVGLIAQTSGLLFLAPVLPLFSATDFPRTAIAGITAGVFGSLLVLLLYTGLAINNTIVAPLSAVIGAIIPTAYSLFAGQALSCLNWIGITLGLGAIVLLTAPTSFRILDRRGILCGAGAGLLYGGFNLSLGCAGPSTGLWPLLMERLTIATFLGAILLLRRSVVQWPKGWPLLLLLLGGALDMAGNALFLGVAEHGVLPIVVLLISLYPGVTVFLGCKILGERINRYQAGGACLAILSIVCTGLSAPRLH